MSQLDRWNAEVEYYPEEMVIDKDGNKRTRAAEVPIPLKVWLQPQGQSGTAARRAERDLEGYSTEDVLRMRLRRDEDRKHTIGAQAKINWDGAWYSAFGNPKQYLGSERTRHNIYTLRRA